MMRKIFLLITMYVFLLSTTMIVKANQQRINLNGYIIYVDAGHGGKDNGANYENIVEDDINLNITKFLVRDLVDSGASVITSRDGDYDLASNYDKNRKNKDLKRRVELINFINPDIFISIHLNTFPSENVSGGQVFAQSHDKSLLLAESLQEQLNTLANKDKKVKVGDYYLLNKAKSIGVIIECGFLTNYSERKKLTSSEYQKKLSENIVNGINNYFIKMFNKR